VLPEDYPEHLALAYVAADNELSRLSDPDQAALAAILEESMTTDDELLQAIGYNEAELERLLEELDQSTLEETFGSKTNYVVGKKTEKQIRVVISMSSVSTLESAILATGQRERGVAIMDICQFYLENKPTDEKR
jgi:histidinol-phosphate/aromatic aminotransferase/cobyric acid decarboxylase-like protein